MTSMEDKLNRRQHQWKTNSMEDDFNGRQPQWKTTSMDDDLNARRPRMEDDLNGKSSGPTRGRISLTAN